MTSSKENRSFPSAGEDLKPGAKSPLTAQTASASYRLAYADDEFLIRDELRGVRLMLEFLKPDLSMQAHRIESTIVVFGSTRIRDPETKHAAGSADTGLGHYYREARRFCAQISERHQHADRLDCVVTTGGGPGIMEACNRGADDVGAKSIGLNIVLPREQLPNPYITPELTFQFHYFALRKLHFLLRARALVAFPGGFGTLDELFDALTLLQTKRIAPMPVLLFGESYWRRIVDFEAMVEIGVISASDLDLFRFVETAEQAVEIISEAVGCSEREN